MKKYITVILLVLFVVLVAYFIGNKDLESPVDYGEDTNFSEVGVITFNNPGQPEGEYVLVYEDEGSPALSKVLVFDFQSVCAFKTKSSTCITSENKILDEFIESRVSVEGFEANEGTVLVKKVYKFREGEAGFVPPVGRVYVTWNEAVALIKGCGVKQVSQAHNLDVALTLKDGQKVYSVSPQIDDVFQIVSEVKPDCGNIIVSTE